MSSRVGARFVRSGAIAALSFGMLAGPRIAPEKLSAQSAPPQPARPVFVDGQAQIVPAFEDEQQWIRQTLWVETEFDSDGDGRRDRMFVDVTRPRQTETEGLKVPVIYESSPYFAGTSGDRKFLWDVKQEVGEPPPPRTSQAPIAFKATRENVSTSLVATWVPRGFAVVHSEAPGTGLSQGCPTVGARPGAAGAEGRDRLAERPREGLHDHRRHRGGRGDRVVDRQGRHDRHVVQRHDSARRGDHRRRRTRGDHSRRAEHVVLPLLPLERPRAAPRRLARRGHRLPLRLRQQRRSGAPRVLQSHVSRRRVRARARSRARRLQRLLGAPRSAAERRSIKAAVLMAHAFNDWNVVPEHSVRIYEALKGACRCAPTFTRAATAARRRSR